MSSTMAFSPVVHFLPASASKRLLCSGTSRLGRYGQRPSSSWTAKFKVDIVTLGKRTSKDAAFDDPIGEYVRRLGGTMTIRERALKRDLAVQAAREVCGAGHSTVILDSRGKMPKDSEGFADIVFQLLQRGRCHMTFFIGDAEGFPKEMTELIDNKSDQRVKSISLSPLTMTHKMVRLLLYEQLYRAVEIRSNSKYHK